MKKFLVFSVVIAMCAIVFPYLFAQAQDEGVSSRVARQEQDLARVFRQHERVRFDTAQVAEQVRNEIPLSIYTASVSFDLLLKPNDMRGRGYRALEVGVDGVERAVEMGAIRTYKGRVLGRDDAQARFTIDENTLEGLIITPEERYMVEPMRKYSPGADAAEFVVYKSSDVINDASMTCEVTMDDQINQTIENLSPQAFQTQAPEAIAALREIEFATEADAEYVSASGGSAQANNVILSIMNQVDGVYQAELGLTFKIVLQHTWTNASTDPYASRDLGTQLNEFKNYWNAHFPPNGPFTAANPRRDAAEMWTGKQGGAGLAFSGINNINGVVCRGLQTPNDDSYSIAGRFPFVPQEYILTAHEIGHNLSATHMDGGACASTIMNTSANNNTQLTFCAASRTQITNYVNQFGSCLTAQAACSYTISPTAKSFPYTGGSDRVTITTTTGCQWSAVSNAAWITITTATSGAGSGAISYTVAANTLTTSRTGTITIAGKTFTVTQAGKPASTFTISGKITIGGTTNGLAGVTVKLTGTRALTATTNSLGAFSFTGLPTGNYRVTPTKLGYLFTPAFRSYTNLSANQAAANFTATARTFTITAKAVTSTGLALAGVTMNLTGMRTGTCATGINGTCQFPNLPAGGSYTVTPSRTGFTFTPARRVYSYLNANVTASFTASP